MANDWMMGIRSSIFTFVDLQYPNMQQSFGLLRTNLFKEVVYKRPSFHAVQHMVNLFRPELRSAGRLNHESNTPRRLTVAGIERSSAPSSGRTTVFLRTTWLSSRSNFGSKDSR